jgi:hypothetical protein
VHSAPATRLIVGVLALEQCVAHLGEAGDAEVASAVDEAQPVDGGEELLFRISLRLRTEVKHEVERELPDRNDMSDTLEPGELGSEEAGVQLVGRKFVEALEV